MTGRNNRDKVAKMAGVSSATVSRVYNNPEKVSADKKESVLKAARELGYSPDKSASALRRKGTGQISLVSFAKKNRTWHWGNFPASKWFFTDALFGILSVVDTSMYRLSVKTLNSPDEIRKIHWNKECDGVLFYDVDDETESFVASSISIPAVISHHTSQYKSNHTCSTDNFEGGKLASQYLINSGCNRGVYISYLPDSIHPNKERYEGFCKGWGKEIPLILTDPGKEGGYRATLPLISEIRAGRIDSIGVVNDLTAIGVIQCLQDNRLKPGKDLGLIGYDNMPLNYVLPFSLATVDLKPAHIYEEAARILLTLISDPETTVVHKTVLPHLVPGESVRELSKK